MPTLVAASALISAKRFQSCIQTSRIPINSFQFSLLFPKQPRQTEKSGSNTVCGNEEIHAAGDPKGNKAPLNRVAHVSRVSVRSDNNWLIKVKSNGLRDLSQIESG